MAIEVVGTLAVIFLWCQLIDRFKNDLSITNI